MTDPREQRAGGGKLFLVHAKALGLASDRVAFGITVWHNYIGIMTRPVFVWDDGKYRENRRKHGVTFEEAATVFRDENGLVMYDPEHSEQEDRFILLGLSEPLRLLVVCHCYRENDGVIRIISARRATRHEQIQYEGRKS